MLTRFFKTIAFTLPVLFALPALAILEINVGGQGILSSSGGGNWTGMGGTNYSTSGAYGLQADVRLNIPLSDWQFGVRYGQLGLSGSSNGYNLSMSSTTYSALVGYRLINTGVLFGPVFTYALSGSGNLQNSYSNIGSATATAGSVSQYSAGLELGIKFPFLLSVEAGYANLTMNGFSANQQINGSATNVALGGTYARASIGLSF
jgi:hypothetical protein